jgi:hypothetical protein|tara:strand:- start:4297 stop:5313 length:1017 start_codon:yes stop_codon:yes gene_type:complete
MSATKPASRVELRDYCKRSLGHPVVEINVDEDQLDDRIDEALEYWNEFHHEGTEKIYLKHQITGSTFAISANSGTLTKEETITGGSSNATAKFWSQNTTTVTFHSHNDQNGVQNNNSSSTFTAGETVTGSSSGSTVTVHGTPAVTFGDMDNHYITIAENVISVTGIFDINDSGSTTSNMFSFQYQFHLNEMPFLQAGFDIANFTSTMSHIQLLKDLFVGKKSIRFNRHMDRLYIDWDWYGISTDVDPDDWVIAEAYRSLTGTTYTDVFNDMFLKKYTTALFKRQWGMNLIKFEGVQLPGGVTLNGARILDEAKEEINALHEEMRLTYELPVDFMVGPG